MSSGANFLCGLLVGGISFIFIWELGQVILNKIFK